MALAAPILLADVQLGSDQLIIDVVLEDLGELEGQQLGGIGLGIVLNGAGAVHFTPQPESMRKTGAQWAAEVSPDTFAWGAFGSASNSANSGGAGNLTTFFMMDDTMMRVTVAEGSIVGRFIFAWDGEDFGDVTFHISGDTGIANPYLLDNNFDPVSCVVSNNDGRVPEPTTMGLLGLGAGVLGWSMLRCRGRR